jgi:hypothetical protein
MQFGSEEAAIREAHWASSASALVVAALLLVALYVIVRATVTRSHKLPHAPLHVQRASEILKWISISSILLVLVGSSVALFDQIIRIGFTGIDVATPYILLGSLLPFLIIGISVSLVTMLGTALIFFKKLRYDNGQRQK